MHWRSSVLFVVMFSKRQENITSNNTEYLHLPIVVGLSIVSEVTGYMVFGWIDHFISDSRHKDYVDEFLIFEHFLAMPTKGITS